jgi:hypothetical protein
VHGIHLAPKVLLLTTTRKQTSLRFQLPNRQAAKREYRTVE